MPNYQILNCFCHFRKKDAVLPATFVAQPKSSEKLLTTINDCFSKDQKCKETGCKYAEGDKEPHLTLPDTK